MPAEWEDRLALHELVGLHGHLMDEGWLADDDLEQVFTPDVVYDTTRLGGPTLKSVGAVRDAALALGDRNPLAHLTTNVVVSFPSADTAVIRSKGLGVRTDGTVGSVTYRDEAIRTSTGWRIRRRDVFARTRPLQPD